MAFWNLTEGDIYVYSHVIGSLRLSEKEVALYKLITNGHRNVLPAQVCHLIG